MRRTLLEKDLFVRSTHVVEGLALYCKDYFVTWLQKVTETPSLWTVAFNLKDERTIWVFAYPNFELDGGVAELERLREERRSYSNLESTTSHQTK